MLLNEVATTLRLLDPGEPLMGAASRSAAIPGPNTTGQQSSLSEARLPQGVQVATEQFYQVGAADPLRDWLPSAPRNAIGARRRPRASQGAASIRMLTELLRCRSGPPCASCRLMQRSKVFRCRSLHPTPGLLAGAPHRIVAKISNSGQSRTARWGDVPCRGRPRARIRCGAAEPTAAAEQQARAQRRPAAPMIGGFDG
jgi:hypothetical protein